jgi:hypothetical protein
VPWLFSLVHPGYKVAMPVHDLARHALATDAALLPLGA